GVALNAERLLEYERTAKGNRVCTSVPSIKIGFDVSSQIEPLHTCGRSHVKRKLSIAHASIRRVAGYLDCYAVSCPHGRDVGQLRGGRGDINRTNRETCRSILNIRCQNYATCNRAC